MGGGGFVLQAEDGIRDLVRSRGLGDVYKRQLDNYGINLYKTRRYQEALKQFHKSGLIALKINDSLRYAKTSVSYTHLTLPTSDLV